MLLGIHDGEIAAAVVEGALSNQPLTDRAHDMLGIASLADSLAGVIATLPTPAPYVVAVGGPWGTGKTSFLNFLEESLEDQDPKPVVVRFSPLWYGQSGELVTHMLLSIAASCGSSGRDERRARALLRSAKWLFVELAKTQAHDPVVAGKAAAAAGVMSAADCALSAVSRRWGDLAWRSPAGLRKRMGEWGLRAKRRLVVLIDDLDRLQPQEVYDLLRAVRTVLDLPYTAIVIALDADHAEQALAKHLRDGDDVVGAREYLQKFFDAVWALPPFEPYSAAALLRVGVEVILAQAEGPAPHLDGPLFEAIFRDHLPALLRSMRDTARIFQQFALLWRTGMAGSVNAADVLALTAVQVVAPGVHARIPDVAAELAPAGAQARSGFDLGQALTDPLHPPAPLPQRLGLPDGGSALLSLLVAVFPALGKAVGQPSARAGAYLDKALSLGMVCTREPLTTYLNHALPIHWVTGAEAWEALAAAESAEDLADWIRRRVGGNPATATSLLLTARAHTGAWVADSGVWAVDGWVERLRILLRALFIVGDDLLSVAARGPWPSPGEFHLAGAVVQVLRELGPQEAPAALRGAMEDPSSLMAMVVVCDELTSDKREGRAEEASVLSEMVGPMTADQAVVRTREKLHQHPEELLEALHPWWVLRFWRDAEDERTPANALLALCMDPDRLVRLARRAQRPPISGGDVGWVFKPHASRWLELISAAPQRSTEHQPGDDEALQSLAAIIRPLLPEDPFAEVGLPMEDGEDE